MYLSTGSLICGCRPAAIPRGDATIGYSSSAAAMIADHAFKSWIAAASDSHQRRLPTAVTGKQ